MPALWGFALMLSAHDKRQSAALSLIMALFDMVKRAEPAGTFRYRKLLDLEVRTCNLVNEWRNMSFDPVDLTHAGDMRYG